MKDTIKILVMFVFIASFVSCQEEKKDDKIGVTISTPDYEMKEDYKHLYFQFNKPINGYEVTGVFFPSYDTTWGDLGSVMLTLKKDNEIYRVMHPYFHMYGLVQLEDFKVIDFENGKTIDIDSNAVPFWFEDVDFDGKEELVIPQYKEIRQRSSYYLSFYDLEENTEAMYGNASSSDFKYRVGRQLIKAPYNDMDDSMEESINPNDQTIKILESGGYCSSSEYIYKKGEDGSMQLSEVVEYEDEHKDGKVKCMKNTYKYEIVKTLIKSELVEE